MKSLPRHGKPFSDGVLVEAWVNFLSQWPWDWFCTLTFRGDAVHPESAAKRFGVFSCKINRSLYGNRWYKRGLGIRWVRALEMQRREVGHYHALVGGSGVVELHRLSWMDSWNELAGFARIERPRNRGSVVSYCVKYVTKGGEVDIGGPTAAWKRPEDVSPGLWDVWPGCGDS